MKRFLIVILLFFGCSCEVVVDIDVPFEGEQLVVNSFVCPDSVWSASISLNKFILSNEDYFKPVGTASVTVYDENGPVAVLQHVSGGVYKSQTEKPEIGKQYTIRVSEPNYTSVEGKLIIPSPVVITSIEIEKVIRDNEPKEITKIKFVDNGATRDFYHIRLETVEDRFDFETDQIISKLYPHPYIKSDNPELNSQVISIDEGLLVKDVLFNGREWEVGILMEYYYSPYHYPEIRAVVRSISEDYYNYLATKKLQDETSGDPFAQPVGVFNNISNGFGIFAGLSNATIGHYNPRPIITEISPSSGKEGDIITVTGQDFNEFVGVSFKSSDGWRRYANVVEVTDTQLKVVVPPGAISGKLLLYKYNMGTLSDVEFQVTN